jgi:predicted HTH transcriptional regulator
MTETNRIEFEAKLTDDLEKEIVAFLNYRKGGILYIGMDDNGQPVQLENIDALQLKIKDRLRNNIAPSCLGLFDVIVEEIDGSNVIKIIIASGSEKPYYIKKRGMSEKGVLSEQVVQVIL